MSSQELQSAVLAAGAVATRGTARAEEAAADLIAAIKSDDDAVRGPAWQNAATAGAPAVEPLSQIMIDPRFEVARSAKRALWKIVRHAGRPGADTKAQAVIDRLLPLLKDGPAVVRREVLWMLSEIGGESVVEPMAALLADPEAREVARCALMRFPGPGATKAFRAAFATAPEEFKFALAESLRTRGEPVEGYPSGKRVPKLKTTVATPERD